MPEANFQNNDPIVMPLPSQARPDDEPQAPSSFTESIRQATLCNQSLSHYQRSIVEQEAQGASNLDFWTRHQQLETSIAMNLEHLSLQDHCANLHLDSLPLLTHMTTQAAIITMYKTMQTSLTQSEINTHQDAIGKLTHMILPAAQRMTVLSKELSELSFFQVLHILHTSHLVFILLWNQHPESAVNKRLRSIHSFLSCSIIASTFCAPTHISTPSLNYKLHFIVHCGAWKT